MTSDLHEIRTKLDNLLTVSTETKTNVDWIKRGMEQGRKRMDATDSRVDKLENRQHWRSGVWAAVSAIGGFLGAHIMKGAPTP